VKLRSLIAASLLLAWLGAPVSAARLEDPRTGKVEKVGPGAEALHLVFFATWCPDCVEELDALRDLEARWGARGYELVIVAVRNRQSADRLSEFLEENAPPGRLLYDVKGEAASEWKASKLPTHVVLDAGGAEAARSSELDGSIEEALRSLLARSRRR
jgi:thiol-disulfide isomerase/thioredoxin